MKKITMFFCLGALLVVFGSYGMAFANSEYPEQGGGRTPEDLDNVDDPGDGELLYGLFTVSLSGQFVDVVHCTLYRGDVDVKEEGGKIKMKGDEYHLFSFQTDHLDFCTFADEYGVSALEEALLEVFYEQPYLSHVDEAFGFTTYEGGQPVWPIGVPVLDDLKIIRLEKCGGDNYDEMMLGFIVVRVFECSPPY